MLLIILDLWFGCAGDACFCFPTMASLQSIGADDATQQPDRAPVMTSRHRSVAVEGISGAWHRRSMYS